MAKTTPTELAASVDVLLDDVYEKYELSATTGWTDTRFDEAVAAQFRREQAVLDRIYELNAKEIGGAELSTDPKSEQGNEVEERDKLIDAATEIAQARAGSGLEDQELYESMGVTNPEHNPLAEQTLRDSQRLADAEAAEKRQLKASKEIDLTAGAAGEGSAIVRAAYQCFLLWNIQYFSTFHKMFLLGSGPNSQWISDSGYEKPVRATGDDQGIPEIRTKGYWSPVLEEPRMLLAKEDKYSSAMINRLNICPGNEDFSNIKNHEHAQLAPLLKIYKLVREPTGAPTAAVEMEFSNSTSQYSIVNKLITEPAIGLPLIGPQAPGDSMWDRARNKGSECGIQSFDWTFLGTDPFTATRDVEAKLKIFFQHFSSLVESRSGKNILAPPDTPEDELNTSYRYIDLIVQPDCRKKRKPEDPPDYGTPTSATHQGECYEIRVDVGYYDPPGESPWLSPEVRDAICCQRDALYLTPVDHQFDFSPDGTMQLTINYRGRLENMTKDRIFNVLVPGGGFVKIFFADPDTGSGISIQAIEEALKTARADEDQEEIKRQERRRGFFYAVSRQYFYNGILNRLNELKMIFHYQIAPDVFQSFSRWADKSYGDASLPDPIGVPSTGWPGNGSVEEARTNYKAPADPSGDADINSNMSGYLDSASFKNRLANSSESNLYKVDYFYLGDLIGVVVASTLGDAIINSTVDSGLAYSSVETVSVKSLDEYELSETGYRDVVDRFKIILGNINVVFPGDDEPTSINLAHIPISLDAFQSFMVKNVLSKNILFYSLFDFLNDVVSDLVTHMFSAECFGGLLSVKSRVGSTILTAAEPLGRSNSDIWERATGLTPNQVMDYKTLDVSKSTPEAPAFNLCILDQISQALPYEYLILNIMDTVPRDLAGTLEPGIRGDPVGDRTRGILHFTYGMDRGLLKSAQFSKTNQEYLPEARFANEGEFVFNQLANVYDVTFNMIGNSIFKPGMHIYFDPTPMGAGKPWQLQKDSQKKVILRSWSSIMGLGGYHMVTEVAHSIKPGKFDTSVKARWVTSGKIPDQT